MSLGEFLRMGGYAFYVWTSYALAAIVLVANIVFILRRDRRVRDQLARRARRRRS